MRTIAIILGDNDFGHTFSNLLKSIFNAIEYDNEFSQETIIKSIHRGIPYFYCTFQYGNDWVDDKHTTFLVNDYLQKITILFDEEAEKDIQTNDHDGEHGI